MIKLEDILSMAYSDVIIMNAGLSVMTISYRCDASKLLSRDFLSKEIKSIDAHDEGIRVWFDEDIRGELLGKE